VAEESFAKAYQLHVGDSLNIFSQQFKLIGIINSGVKPAKADFYAPIEHVKSILKGKLPRLSQGFDVNIILVEVADARNQEKVINAVKSTMQNPSILGYNCYEPARKAISIIERASILINILISLFLIIFATKTQLSALTKRLQEIGILKSLGWSDKRLARQIIISSTIQAMIGAIAGCLLAFLAASLLNAFKINIIEATSINIQFSKIVLVMGLSILGGLIACVFPIIKIIQLKPGEILQTYN
jgi:ABC-type lipoprotein release transport system permease subunit